MPLPPKIGRPLKFTDEKELMYYFEEYLQELEERNTQRIKNDCVTKFEYPNLAGFARKCYMDKYSLLRYKEEGHVFCDVMNKILSYLEDETISNKMSDNFKKFYMVNTFKDYSDSQKIEQRVENITVELKKST